MSLRSSILRGTAVLTAGQVLAQALAFGRNIIIARLLSPHDVGVAATLAIGLSLVEMIADVSIDKLLIQAPDGDDPGLQASCQAANLVRGIVTATVLYCLSWPLAGLFDVTSNVWAFQCVAIGPLIKGLSHLDYIRWQRELRFLPAAGVDLIPQIVSFLLVVPLALWLKDFRAVLFAVLLQAGLYVVCTHALAHRPYRWSWDATAFRRIAVFGWPLMINGALLFAIAQGDRIAIGAAYRKEDLALWANALLLASAPLMLLGRVAVSVALPLLAKCRDDRVQFDSRYELLMQGLAWVAAMVAVPLILGGGAIMELIFGSHYAAAGGFVGILAAAQAVRVCRIGPTVAALAHGETTNAAIGNAARLVGVGAAMALAFNQFPLEAVALAAVGGEILSFGASATRLMHKRLLRMWQSALPIAPVLVAMLAGMLVTQQEWIAPAWVIPVALVGGLGVGAALLFPFERLRREPLLLFSIGRSRMA